MRIVRSMRRILSSCVLGALGLALFLSCSEDEGLSTLDEEGSLLELSVRVEEPTTKGMIHTNYLPAGSELGLTVTDMSGGNYNGHNYQNIKYTANDHNGGVKWQGSDPVKMTETPGKIVAYYPYRESVNDPKSIPVDVNEQTDWLYSGSMEGFDKTNVKAEMQMQHAQSAVQVSLRRGTYIGTGELTSVSWSGDCLGSSGKLDATTGQFKSIVKSAITKEGSWTLSPAAETFETFVVPTGVTGNLNVELVVDGTTYQASIPSVSLVRSQVYQCKLVVNASSLEVDEVGVVPWTVLNKGSVSYGQTSWKSFPNGVYYVGPDGNYQATASADCIGVALINNERDVRIMIEKYEDKNASYKKTYEDMGLNSSGNLYFYWGYYGKTMNELLGVTDYMQYRNLRESYHEGKLPDQYGNYLNSDPWYRELGLSNSWPKINTAFALADTAGYKYSRYLMQVAVSDGYSNHPKMGQLLKTFLESSDALGYADWYIPTLGQLALLYIYKSDINEALSAIGGTILKGWSSYWSSSEYSVNFSYVVGHSGIIDFLSKNSSYYYVRLVRNV